MIQFHTEIEFKLKNQDRYSSWIEISILTMKKEVGKLNYIFCDDAYLLKINQDYLNHDTYTDIISFDYSEENKLSGDIFISVERVKENAKSFQVDFNEELRRVLIHGILHFNGLKDKTIAEKEKMREQEDAFIALFHR